MFCHLWKFWRKDLYCAELLILSKCFFYFKSLVGSGNCLAIHNNGHSLAVALSSGSVRIYDIRHKKLLQHYILHDNTTSLSWHPSSGFLLTAGKDKNIRIVDVLEGKPIYTLTGHEGGVNCISFDKTGEHFVSADSDRHVLVNTLPACFWGKLKHVCFRFGKSASKELSNITNT